MNAQHPTNEEIHEHSIRSVEMEIGEPAPGAVFATELAQRYPNHLILIQAGKFLHAFDKSAYALHALKKYKIKLTGTTESPHLRVGFPVAQHNRRMWKILDEFGIPYVVALGSHADGYKIFESDMPRNRGKVLVAVSPEIVDGVIRELQQRSELNATATAQLLKSPEQASFQFKAKVQELDTLLTNDIAKMPRDLRCCYGENVRQTMHRIVRGSMAYGLSGDKKSLLRELSGDIDQLKHYIAQSQKLDRLNVNFDHRAGLSVEIGRLVGGLIRKGDAP